MLNLGIALEDKWGVVFSDIVISSSVDSCFHDEDKKKKSAFVEEKVVVNFSS